MIFRSRALPRFWEILDLFAESPFHPSLHFKPLGEFWSVRVTDDYRALAVRNGNDFVWVWIGPHDAYEQRIRK